MGDSSTPESNTPAQESDAPGTFWSYHTVIVDFSYENRGQPFIGVIPGKVALEFSDPTMPEP